MKRNTLKNMTPALVSALLLSGCIFGPSSSGGGSTGSYAYNTPGTNKVEINLKNFGGGIGRVWIDEAADRFAKEVQDTQFGDKTGVYIKIENTFNENAATMDNNGADVYFDERESDITDLAQRGLLYNLDAIYNDTNRVGGKLADKIFPNAIGSVSHDGSFYGLPHYEYYGGLSYNRNLFDRNNAYFVNMKKADPEVDVNEVVTKFGNAQLIYDEQAPKSVGPDGIENTQDDGLPSTLVEFLQLCDYLKNKKGISPFVISGKHARNYADYLVAGLWANLAGTQQMKNYYDCTGTIEIVERDSGTGALKFTSDNLFSGVNYLKKPVVKSYTFKGDGTDGYLGNDMVAKYYALAILDIMKQEGYFNAESFQSGKDHYAAQQNLMFYGIPQTPYSDAAMLIDGSYWNNEAKEQGSYNTYEQRSGKDKSTCDCRWMALPVAVDSDSYVGREQCLLDMGQAYASVNAKISQNPAKEAAVVALIKFLYSEQELKNFTTCTGMPRMIDCGLTATEKETAGSFYKNMFELRKDNGTNVIGLGSSVSYWKSIRNLVRVAMGKGPMLKDGKTAWLSIDSTNHADTVFEFFSYKESTWVETRWPL